MKQASPKMLKAEQPHMKLLSQQGWKPAGSCEFIETRRLKTMSSEMIARPTRAGATFASM